MYITVPVDLFREPKERQSYFITQIITVHCSTVMRHPGLVYTPASHNALRAELA
jgi:hypothetical protein